MYKQRVAHHEIMHIHLRWITRSLPTMVSHFLIRMAHPTPSTVNARGVGVTNIGKTPNDLITRKKKT